MAMSEGMKVNVAFNGPKIDHDQFIGFAAERNGEDRKRASSAGESRAKIKEFLEETGMNGKALSWMRQVLKLADKDDGQAKAMDVIMSLKKALPMVEAHVAGQGTVEMDFGNAPSAPAAEPEKPKRGRKKAEAAEPASTYEGSNAEIAAEDAAFEAHLASVEGDAA